MQVGGGVPSNIHNAKYAVDSLTEFVGVLEENDDALEYIAGNLRIECRFESNLPFKDLYDFMIEDFVKVRYKTQWISVPYALTVKEAIGALRDFAALEVLAHRDSLPLERHQQEALCHLQNKCGVAVRQSIQYIRENGWTVSWYRKYLEDSVRREGFFANMSARQQAYDEDMRRRAARAAAVDDWERESGEPIFNLESRSFCFYAIATRDHSRARNADGSPKICGIMKRSRGGQSKAFDSKDELVDFVWGAACAEGTPLAWMQQYRINPDFEELVAGQV
jgi:hypothetical protein